MKVPEVVCQCGTIMICPECELSLMAHLLGHTTQGASKGGHARAARLTPKRRREIAQHAARARWGAALAGRRK